MSVASFVASQRTEHRVPHALCCRWLGSARLVLKWRDRPPTRGQPRASSTRR